MTEGMRDAFIENDVIGNFSVGSQPLVGMAGVGRRKRRKSHKRKMRHVSRKHRRRRIRRRHNSRRSSKIKYTKKGQPYKIMPNGRARFIKK